MYAHMLTNESVQYYTELHKKGMYKRLLRNTLFLGVLILQAVLSLYFSLL